MDTRFGHPDDWGLSPQRHAEIASELSDHLDCLQADEGHETAREAEQRLAEPQTRRRLTAAHIADQVCATLHRWPSRPEWRELGWLLFWYLLVILFTFASGEFNAEVQRTMWTTDRSDWPPKFSSYEHALTFVLWLLSAACRAGFLSLLLTSMIRAWRIGPGVFIARLLQYKLLHTVLVLAGMLLVSGVDFYKAEMSMQLAAPVWINHITLGAFFLIAGLAAALRLPRQRLGVALFSILLVAFLVPSGPYVVYDELAQRPIAYREIEEDGIRVLLPADDDPAAVQRQLEDRPRMLDHAALVDIPGNRFAFWLTSDRTFGPYWSNWKYQQYHRPQDIALSRRRIEGRETLDYRQFVYSPFTHPGSGLAWLAVPLPIMGVLGFLGMVLVMGRRNPLSVMLYSLICLIAIATTIMPFGYAQIEGQTVILTSEALVHTPLPGFETLMHGYTMREDWMLVFGLLFSAGIPWLLTGLFLRGESGKVEPVDDDGEVATG